MNAQRNRRRFTKEFKDDAVSLVIEQGYSCAEVGRRLGVSENNVNRWVRKYRDNKESASSDGLSRDQLEDTLSYWWEKFMSLNEEKAVKLLSEKKGSVFDFQNDNKRFEMMWLLIVCRSFFNS
jgi:hypothetical protein